MHFSHHSALHPPFLWLSLLFFPTSLSVGSYFILLSLSVPLSLSSLVPASKIFQWLESNLLRGRRRHRANANSVFLSESVWGCVSNRYENINQVRRSKKVQGRLVFGRNDCTLHPNSWLVKQREERGESKKGGRESEIRRGIESGDKTGTCETGTVNKCVIKTNFLPSPSLTPPHFLLALLRLWGCHLRCQSE